VEFFMGPWKDDRIIFRRYGFKFFNTGPARIAGVDLSLGGQNQVNSFLKYTFFFAYSFTNPKMLEPDFIFTETGTKKYNYGNTSSDTTGRIMKYRLEHVIKADLDFTFFNKIRFWVVKTYSLPFNNSITKNEEDFFYEHYFS